MGAGWEQYVPLPAEAIRQAMIGEHGKKLGFQPRYNDWTAISGTKLKPRPDVTEHTHAIWGKLGEVTIEVSYDDPHYTTIVFAIGNRSFRHGGEILAVFEIETSGLLISIRELKASQLEHYPQLQPVTGIIANTLVELRQEPAKLTASDLRQRLEAQQLELDEAESGGDWFLDEEE